MTSEAPAAAVEKDNRFPIQLRRVEVGEIHYSCGGFPVPSTNPICEYSLEAGFSGYDDKAKSFQVMLAMVAKNDPSKSGFALNYTLTVRVHAEYVVVGEFPMDKLERWANLNGTAILMPFLRETVHSITVKSGFKPFILPMVEAPLFKVAPPTKPS